MKKKRAKKAPKADPTSIVLQTQSGLARCTGFDLATVKKWLADPEFPCDRKGPFNLATVLTWWRKQKHRPAAAETDTDEAIKREKLLMLRMARLKEQGQLVPREQWQPCLAHLAAFLRRASDTLARQHGTEAHKVLDDALLRFEDEAAKFFAAPIDGLEEPADA